MNLSEFSKLLDNQLNELVETYPAGLRSKQRAFTAWTLLHIPDLDLSEEEAVDAIVDGNQEKGIDAILIPDRGGRLVVLQTTLHQEPSGKGVRKNQLVRLFAGVDWLLDGDLSMIDKNPNFKAKAEEFRAAYYNFDYSAVSIVYATNAANGPGKEERDEMALTAKQLASRGAPFTIDVYSATEISNLLLAAVHKRFDIDLDLVFVGKSFAYEKQKGGARALVGIVKGRHLAEIYDKHSFRIFDTNIRNFLGNVKINKGIMRTATDPTEANSFWFYNNGITFVCDEFSFRSLEDTIVRLHNAQIINGCQTVTSLHRTGTALSEEVEVLVRVIEKKADIDFVRRVTLFANSQNAVRPADLVGTDTSVLELKRRLLPLNVYLETRRGDYRAERHTLAAPLPRVVSLKQAAQALATTFRQIPGIAKKDTSKLFLSREDGGFYEDLINPSVMPEQVVAAVATTRAIGAFRVRIEENGAKVPSWLPHSDYFLAAMFFAARFDQTRTADGAYLKAFTDWISSPPQDEAFKAYQAFLPPINKIVAKNEKTYGYSHPTFFKTQAEYDKWFRPVSIRRPFHVVFQP